MLEEVSVQGGKLAERIIATNVDTQPAITDATFAITGTPTPLGNGGYRAQPDRRHRRPGARLLAARRPAQRVPAAGPLRAAPRCQPHHRRDGHHDDDGGGQAPTIVDSYVDVYVSGNNTIIITQGPTTGEPSTQTTGGITGDIGTLGSTTALASLTGSTLAPTRPVPPAGTCTCRGRSRWPRPAGRPSPCTRNVVETAIRGQAAYQGGRDDETRGRHTRRMASTAAGLAPSGERAHASRRRAGAPAAPNCRGCRSSTSTSSTPTMERRRWPSSSAGDHNCSSTTSCSGRASGSGRRDRRMHRLLVRGGSLRRRRAPPQRPRGDVRNPSLAPLARCGRTRSAWAGDSLGCRRSALQLRLRGGLHRRAAGGSAEYNFQHVEQPGSQPRG